MDGPPSAQLTIALPLPVDRARSHPSVHGVDGPAPPREPLEVQLENLELWHASMLAGLRSFKSRFRSASCTLMAMADKDVSAVGACMRMLVGWGAGMS